MLEGYAYGILTVALVLIALFIMAYAYLFTIRTHKHKDRKPWDFLFAASIMFLVFEILSMLEYFSIIQFVAVDLILVSKIFEFIYSGLVLLAIVSQHDLILKHHMILISRRDQDGLEEQEEKR